jgi:hypothetical protein
MTYGSVKAKLLILTDPDVDPLLVLDTKFTTQGKV